MEDHRKGISGKSENTFSPVILTKEESALGLENEQMLRTSAGQIIYDNCNIFHYYYLLSLLTISTTMGYGDYTPSSHHSKKPLTKAQIRKLQEAYSRADEITAEVEKREREEQKQAEGETEKLLGLI